TPLFKISILLLCSPLITGFTMLLPMPIVETPEIAVSDSANGLPLFSCISCVERRCILWDNSPRRPMTSTSCRWMESCFFKDNERPSCPLPGTEKSHSTQHRAKHLYCIY